MPNDENKIILEFPATNVEIELGETITFDNISGFLNSDRVTYNGESLTDEITHLENDKADASYVDTELANKMDKANPTGTGSLSLNRRADSIVGENSVAMGTNTRATGTNTTALGYDTLAYGTNGVAMGNGTTARDENAVAMGMGTRALGKNQFVFGKYNSDNNYSNYVEIVGKGNVFARSNARTLDWQGNETLAGDLIFNGNKSLESEISRLDNRITDLPEAMVFKGTLGVGGTIETLPTASAENEGWVFKCITEGTYAGLELKVGDTVTCFNPPNTSVYEWEKTGSQDTDTDTWRNIKVNGVEKLGNGISSGAVDFVGSENIEVEFDSNGNKVGVKTKNIYTKTEVDDIVSDAIYNVLPDDTASGSVANFNTSLALPIKSLEVDVNAIQEAGTPTPSSPKAISGWSAITLDVNGNTEVINLGGTYYGGHFTQDKAGHRQFVATHGITDLGEPNWYYSVNDNWFQIAHAHKYPTSNNLCSCYPVVYSLVNLADKTIAVVTGYLAIKDTSFGSDVNAFKTAMTGQKLVYELATPVIIDLPDGEPINTFAGTNNFFADTGDSTVVFKSSVNDYVSAHSGGNLLGMGGVYLGGAKSGGSEEETDDGENTEKAKLDETKVEVKEIGDVKKLGGE